MKRTLLIYLLILGTVGSLSAQRDGQGAQDRIQAFRIATFTEVLQLTPDEAAQFWPVYNQYNDKREALKKQFKRAKQVQFMSDTEVEQEINNYFDKKQKELDLEKQLFQDLRNILPNRKLAKLPLAERRFRESLIKKIQENRERRQNNRMRRN